MKLLAFFLALLIWLTVLVLVRLHIDLSFNYKKTESRMVFRIKTLFASLLIKIVIPRDMLSSGIKNIVSIIIRDMSSEEVVTEDNKNTGKRYLLLRHFSGEVSRKYFSNWPKFIYLSTKMLRLKKMFYKKIELYSISLRVEFGTGDASETGIMTGAIWAFLGQMQARVYKSVTVKKDNIRYHVIPRFDQQILLSEINCILHLKISHIIFTALKFLRVIIKIRRIRNNG